MTAFAAALEAALAARDRGDDREELIALLAAWRLVPDPGLASAIASVSLRVERVVTRGFGHMDRVKQTRLLEVIRRGGPENIGWVVPLLGTTSLNKPALAALAALPPDPRVAAALPALVRWRAQPADSLDALRERHVPPAAPIPEAAHALHAHVMAPVVAHERGERALLEQVWANPDDDGARQVYADWLLEREHPRGEVIALQLATGLSAPDQRRLKRLFDRFGFEWLGPLADVVVYPGYRRGFIESVHLGAVPLTSVLRRPEWSTVREVHTTTERGVSAAPPPPGTIALLIELGARNLRKLEGLDSNRFHALAAQPAPLAITELGFALHRPPTASELAATRESRAFPHVHTIRATAWQTDLEWIVGSTLGDRVECLELSVAAGPPAAQWLLRFLHRRMPHLRQLTLQLGGGTAIADSSGILTLRNASARVATTLDALPAASFRAVRLDGTVSERDAVVIAAARHGGIV
ncbi:MAG: TIGR02996 domain-containing protein [Kofleriaceae bacterium]